MSAREPVCPPALIARALACPPPRVAIANAGSALPMRAAFEATKLGIMSPVLVGARAAIKTEAERLNWDISRFELIDAEGEAAAAMAATAACAEGRADVLMKGHVHSDVFLNAALDRAAGLRTRARPVHIFHISHPDGGRPLLISDAVVNIAPKLRSQKAILRAVVELLHVLGTPRPKVAILSATDSVIAAMPSTANARVLRDWARASLKNADFSGPLALDLILSSPAAALKGLTEDPVAGRADAIIVPDIVTGNALFKALVYLSGGCAAGVVTGAKVPILLTSRADPPAARSASVALAAIMAAA